MSLIWGARSLLLKNVAHKFLREGIVLRRILADLEKNAARDIAALTAYQDEHLRRAIVQAYAEVPYYKRMFDELRLAPDDIHSIHDLSRLPVLTKSDLRGREDEFVSRHVRWKLKGVTSGTTGKPLTLYRDWYSVVFENAVIWRQWRWAGYQIGQRRATFRNYRFKHTEDTSPPYWLFLPATNQLLFSAYHMTDVALPHYLAKLRSWQPVVLEGYPSAVYRLAHFMQASGEKMLGRKAVFTLSEQLHDYQREVIEEYIGPVYDYYGNAERNAHLGMCEYGNYHVSLDYSIVEFVPDAQGRHEIVGTTLHNRAMPLLRYATGDIVTLGDTQCACGRSFPIVASIEGRRDDYIITPSGKWLGRFGAVVLKGLSGIVETQIVQDRLDHISVYVVRAPDYHESTAQSILQKSRAMLGADVDVDIVYVDEIARTEAGKHKMVISHLVQAQTATPNEYSGQER